MKRQSIKTKDTNMSKELDSLFRKEDLQDTTNEPAQNKKDIEDKEPRIRGVEKIKDYYAKSTGGEQYTIYLPEELQDLIKIKALYGKMSVSAWYKKMLLDNVFSDDDIRQAYNNGYDRRNGSKK